MLHSVTQLAYIPSPSHNGFYIWPLFFHVYGICYVIAVAAARTFDLGLMHGHAPDEELLDRALAFEREAFRTGLSELTADLLYVHRPAFVRETRIACDHEQPTEERQCHRDVLHHAICKILLLRIGTDVLEGKHGN